MTFMKQSLIALAVLAGCATALPACSNSDVPSPEQHASTKGQIDLNLAVGTDTLASVNMKIFTGTTATGTPIISKLIDVHTSNATVSAFVGALTAGDFTVTFDATTTPSNSTCHGQDTFTITAGTTNTKTVTITCGTVHAPPARGNEIINGTLVTVSDCPFLENTVIAPLQTDLGASIALSTDSSDPTASVAWTEGATSIAATASASYTCSAAGTHHLTVTLTKGACTEAVSADVTCVGSAPTGGGGAGGASGGAGGSTGGAGGSTGGTAGAGGSTGGTAGAGGSTGGAGGTGGGTAGAGGSTGGTGGGTGGVPAFSYCVAPHSVVADPGTCTSCESDQCDAPVAPGCTRFADGTSDRAKCEDVLQCIRDSNCIAVGNVKCYCGSADIGGCTAAQSTADGVCKARIEAAYPAGSTAAVIVSGIGDPTIPGGAALALGQCDRSFCGATGNGECTPYCSQ
jgi:hypothetical protein